MSVTYDVLNAKVSRHDLIDPRPSDVFSIAYTYIIHLKRMCDQTNRTT